jgi:hypothetical protein
MSIVIFLQLWFCHFASFSKDVVCGLCAFELAVVGMGGFEGLFVVLPFVR